MVVFPHARPALAFCAGACFAIVLCDRVAMFCPSFFVGFQSRLFVSSLPSSTIARSLRRQSQAHCEVVSHLNIFGVVERYLCWCSELQLLPVIIQRNALPHLLVCVLCAVLSFFLCWALCVFSSCLGTRVYPPTKLGLTTALLAVW